MAARDVLKQLDGMFVFGLVWSVGATTDSDGRTRFSDFLRKLLDGQVGHLAGKPAPRMHQPVRGEGGCAVRAGLGTIWGRMYACCYCAHGHVELPRQGPTSLPMTCTSCSDVLRPFITIPKWPLPATLQVDRKMTRTDFDLGPGLEIPDPGFKLTAPLPKVRPTR